MGFAINKELKEALLMMFRESHIFFGFSGGIFLAKGNIMLGSLMLSLGFLMIVKKNMKKI